MNLPKDAIDEIFNGLLFQELVEREEDEKQQFKTDIKGFVNGLAEDEESEED